jgi:hypothetical protein
MAQLMARSIGYDKNLKARAGEQLVIALVYEEADAASKAHCASMEAAFGALRGVRVQGIPIDIVSLAYSKSFAEDAKKKALDVVYVCPNVKAISDITAQSQKLKLLTIAGEPADIERGLTLSATQDGERVVLVINRASAQAENVVFAEQILGVAKLVH